jgi:glycosyltransferase involved in cell wall biosynthesis
MRSHNVEYKIWERLAKEEKNIGKKIYLGKLAKQLKAYEQSALNLCDGVITITQADMDTFKQIGCISPMAHIPFGVSITHAPPLQNTNPDSLFYIGALDWMPNLQGIEWFLTKVWPLIHTQVPEVNLHIAGRNMPASMKNTKLQNVVFHGEVESASGFINTYNIMIAPLLAGSGVRIKIIESMAMQKPVITTTVGIEGIECEYGKDVMIADSAEDFCKTVVYCIKNPALTKQLAINGFNFVEKHHDITKITGSLTDFYRARISDKTLKAD